MKVVALISGGKDSCFNMMHCVAMGHQIVALANLQPLNDGETDSYMYQSVGHEAIQFYAKALDLPLYRRKIQGYSKSTSLNYSQSNEDEVEDLYQLLKEIKNELVFEGVSCGAILSDYQRIRVENVCSRLELVSLAFLWRRNQHDLMQEMVENNLHSVLIKTAALGLNQKHLGKSLTEMQDHLITLHEKYGSHICGEGGEYETFTLDCPLFKQRIIIDDSEIVVHSDDDVAPVTYLYLKACHLEDKPNHKLPDLSHLIPVLKIPKKLEFKEVLNAELSLNTLWKSDVNFVGLPTKVNVNKYDCFLFVSGLFSSYGIEGNKEKIKAVSKEIFQKLTDTLTENGHSLQCASYVHLYISNMDHFAVINSVYKTYFNVNPPARVCVGLRALNNGNMIMMECISCCHNSDCKVMHVQGISHWAPANIGPYSQCVSRCGLYFVAGQIGLHPGSMELKQSIEEQGYIALEHAKSVLSAMDPQLQMDKFSQCVCYVTNYDFISIAKSVWDFSSAHFKDWQLLEPLYVVVSSLPKNAKIEWQVTASQSEIYSHHVISSNLPNEELDALEHLIALKKSLEVHRICVDQSFQKIIQLRLFYKQGYFNLDSINYICQNLQENGCPPISYIPVNNIVKHNSEAESCMVLLCLTASDL